MTRLSNVLRGSQEDDLVHDLRKIPVSCGGSVLTLSVRRDPQQHIGRYRLITGGLHELRMCTTVHDEPGCGPECPEMTERTVDATRTMHIRTRTDRQHQAVGKALRERTRPFVICTRCTVHPRITAQALWQPHAANKLYAQWPASARPAQGPTGHELAPRDAPAHELREPAARACGYTHTSTLPPANHPRAPTPTQRAAIWKGSATVRCLPKFSGAASVRFRGE